MYFIILQISIFYKMSASFLSIDFLSNFEKSVVFNKNQFNKVEHLIVEK